MIVDSQVHVWASDTPQRPWPPGRAAHAHGPSLGVDELRGRMAQAGVDRAILVPPSWEGDRNDLALQAARDHPDTFAVMGRVPVEKPESRAVMSTWMRQPGMLGMRFTFRSDLQRPWLSDGTADWLWPAAEAAGIPLMVLVPGSLPLIDRIAADHPRLKLTIDHLACERTARDEAAFPELDWLLKLARRPNVSVKATGLPRYSSEPYPYPRLHAILRRIIEAYGPERVFWGSDSSRIPCTYRQVVTMFTEEMPWLSESDQEWVMGRGIREWLGWR
jgi:predicted TIM-barrel fold metal-dependent hydrolase